MAKLAWRRVNKAFGGVRALADVDLQLPESGVIAIIGPNGAGKTTLFNVMTGFEQADSGECVLEGRNVTNLAAHSIARLGVARMFQELRIIRQMTVLENVELARRKQVGERLWRAFLRVGVADDEGRNREAALGCLSTVGLLGKAHELASTLSYGEQRLLNFAVCIAAEAKIYLLDEPVTGLHPSAAQRVLEQLSRLGRDGRLVVFIEHDIAAIKAVANSIIVMESGAVVENGPTEEIVDRSDLMERFLG